MEYVKLIFNLLFYFSLCTMLEISIPPFSLLGCARELGNCLLRWRWWRSSPQWKNWSTLLSHCSSWLLSILCYALGRNHGGSDVLGYFCTADLPTKFTLCINIKAFAFVCFCTCSLFKQKNQSYRLSKSIIFWCRIQVCAQFVDEITLTLFLSLSMFVGEVFGMHVWRA